MPWRTADVIVAGLGNAAEAAAFSAHQNGAKVLVLEKAPEAKKGGNTWFSSGAQLRHAHNGLAEERALVPQVPASEFEIMDLVPYTKDDFYNDLMRVTNGRSVPELAELLVNESYPTVKWMQESGITWEILYPDYKVGGRFKWHHGQGFIHSRDGGAGLVEMWHEILKREGVEILFETPLVSLLADEAGRVYGVRVQTDEGYQEIHAKALVLGCGGFGANPALRAQWLGPGWDLAKVRGTRYNTGDGIQAALDIGAQSMGHYS
ncbi:MAG: FAD-binding protein, partial [Chloroflexi bacterium]|nr:FAD-binding protein [Chloroflexota bacterium]